MRSYIIFLPFSFLPLIFCCPTDPTEFLIVIKAAYYLSDYQWNSVKNLLVKFSNSINLGRTDKSSQIGIYLFDNLNDPVSIIPLGSYGRKSDLSTAVQKLQLLPCGTWCAEHTQKTDAEQITTILTKQPFTRPAKVIVVTTEYLDSYSLQSLTASSTNVVIQQMIIPNTPGVVPYNAPYYNYYQAYYDSYRRYASRMEQIYPYMQVAIPENQYPLMVQTDRYGNYDYESWAGSVCYSLIGCQECITSTPQTAASVDTPMEMVTVHSGDSKSSEKMINSKLATLLSSQKESSPNLPKESNTESKDYEYEITADPPGMKINKTPLLDEVNEKSVSDEDLI